MKLKGAIIGFGFIAKEGHLPAWLARSDVDILAVADENPERQAVARSVLPGVRGYASALELLAREDLDFVDICSPPASHRGFILAALERGLHVLCEKPLVLETTDLADIAALQGPRSVYTVHNWKYAPIFIKITELLLEGRLGTVREIDYEVLRTQPSVAVAARPGDANWRLDPRIAGGGILVDHGWHAFYNIGSWIAKPPRNVECQLENRTFKDLPVEDTATVHIDFGDARARLFFTWAASERKNTLRISGSAGELSVQGNVLHLKSAAGDEAFTFAEALSQGSHHPEWFPPVIEGFIQSRTDPGARNLTEAALSLKLLDCAKRSHRAGAPVAFAHDKSS